MVVLPTVATFWANWNWKVPAVPAVVRIPRMAMCPALVAQPTFVVVVVVEPTVYARQILLELPRAAPVKCLVLVAPAGNVKATFMLAAAVGPVQYSQSSYQYLALASTAPARPVAFTRTVELLTDWFEVFL